MKTTYLFCCDNCDYSFTVEMDPRHFKNKKTCKKCGQKKLYQKFGIPHIAVKLTDTELKTVGHLADRNRDRWSDDRKLDQTHKDHAFLEERDKQPSVAEEMTGAEASTPYKKPEKLIEKPAKKRKRKVKKRKNETH